MVSSDFKFGIKLRRPDNIYETAQLKIIVLNDIEIWTKCLLKFKTTFLT